MTIKNKNKNIIGLNSEVANLEIIIDISKKSKEKVEEEY